MNDPKTTVVTGPSPPTAEERVIMLEEEICQLMDTNCTLQQSIQDVQQTLEKMAIAKQSHPPQVTAMQHQLSSASNSSHSSNRANTPSSI